MNFQFSLPVNLGQTLPRADLRPAIGMIGDRLNDAAIENLAGPGGQVRAFSANRFSHWLRILLPGAEVTTHTEPGPRLETTVALAQRLPAWLQTAPHLDALLISTGTDDCLAAMSGGAPEPDQTVEALEAMARACLEAGIRPLFVVPLPSSHFSNGLFADRHIAIAATLRRMARKDPRIMLIDATSELRARRSFGIEPDRRLIDAAGEPTITGAFELAQIAAETVSGYYVGAADILPHAEDLSAALNTNPTLAGEGGFVATSAAIGRCADGYRLDAQATGGASLMLHSGTGMRLVLAGRYGTTWGFFRLSQEIAAEALANIRPGEAIEALCHFDLGGGPRNIACLSLQATPVWDSGYIGLKSQNYAGSSEPLAPHAGCLRTPVFKIPGKLKSLHVSLSLHLVPGQELDAAGKLTIRSIILRRAETADAPPNRSVS